MSEVDPDDAIRHRLQALRADALRRGAGLADGIGAIVDATADVATDDEHDPEGHTIAWERQQLAGLLRETRAAVEQIDEALVRLAGGSYGVCTTCGCVVSAARLDALPATPHCVRCAGQR